MKPIKDFINENDDIILRRKDSPNDDYLLPSSGLYHYIPNDMVGLVKEKGLFSPGMTPSRFSDYKRAYSEHLGHSLLSRSICVHFCRAPELDSRMAHLADSHTPVKISISKMNKANQGFKIYGVNFPTKPDPFEISEKLINKLSSREDVWHAKMVKSEHPYLLDIPHCAIYSTQGTIPAFALKVLDDSYRREE